MARYLIVAQDEMYQGMHGIEDWTIKECSNEQEAFFIGHVMSLDLIDSYADIYDSFRDNAEYWAGQMEEEGQYFDREDYILKAIEEQREDDIKYLVWKLSDNYCSEDNSSDWRDIAENYGEEEY